MKAPPEEGVLGVNARLARVSRHDAEKNPPAAYSQRSDPQHTDRGSQMAEALEGSFRSPGSIEWSNGPTKCGGYLLRSSLTAALPEEQRVLARRGWAGEQVAFLSILPKASDG